MCQLLESIKCQNGLLYNIRAHEMRMNKSVAQLLGVEMKWDLKGVIKKVAIPEKGLYKCRIVYSERIESIEFIAYKKKKIKDIALVQDDAMSYPHKLLDRACIEKYSQAFHEQTEIIFIKKNRLTDASYSNLVLFNGTEYHTPTYPLLKGTMRKKLLAEGKIKLKNINTEDMDSYQSIHFINALNDLGERVYELK
jgi:4-amino-4-deoxychorismate lyase